MNLVINDKKIWDQIYHPTNAFESCVIFWWLWNTYASEWDEQRISMPLSKIDPIGGGSCVHIPFGI